MNLFAEVKEGFFIPWGAIRANKLRSSLTTLGIVIGIVTVTLMGTAIEGLNRFFAQSLASMGPDVFYIERFNWFIDSFEEWLKASRRREITMAQVKALERQLTLAQAVAPVVRSGRPVKYKNQNSSRVTIIGTSDQYLQTGGLTVADGRFMSISESDGGRPVCVIGAAVATNLCLNEPPLGNPIKIADRPFEVIGVLEKQGTFLGPFSPDSQIFV